MAVLLLVVLQLAGPDSDCTKGRRPNLDEGGRLATPKMDGFGVEGLGCRVFPFGCGLAFALFVGLIILFLPPVRQYSKAGVFMKTFKKVI